MSMLLGIFAAFALYWIILFVVCFAVVEYGQNYFYDEATPSAGLKVAAGSAILAALLTWTRTEFHTMFTADLLRTILLAIVAFGVFTLIFQFQPWHALPIGLVSVLLISGTATMAVQSFSDRNRPLASEGRAAAKPLRGTTKVNPPPTLPGAKTEPATDKSAPAKK